MSLTKKLQEAITLMDDEAGNGDAISIISEAVDELSCGTQITHITDFVIRVTSGAISLYFGCFDNVVTVFTSDIIIVSKPYKDGRSAAEEFTRLIGAAVASPSLIWFICNIFREDEDAIADSISMKLFIEATKKD